MQKIGSYTITEKIAEGGMAVVYQGLQESLNRPVAIKVLKQKFLREKHVVEYFKRESLIIARLIHPNIIHVIDRGLTKTGRPYFVMNFIKGTDTARLIHKGGLSFNRKLDIVINTCKALAYAHKNGVIHRDVKPANILIDSEGNAVVTDFGIAQFYQSENESEEESADKKQKKERLGTPTYMSPEQKINSSEVTFASDIYSLGVVMYELFTGKRFPKKIERPAAAAPDIPEALERIILQCLSYDPEKRPASVEMIKNQLFELFRGAHIATAQREKALSGVPKMNDIFTILDVIRQKKTGSVYLLRHNDSDQLMVAKTFNAMNNGIKTARLLLSLKHDNIIGIQGVSASDTNYIVVMEYLSGGSLADRMVMTHSWQESVRLIHGVCEGLFFAHNNRIFHGNLKPANILFTPSETVKLSDFGFGAANRGKSQKDMIQADILATGAIFYKMVLGFGPVLNGDSFVPHKKFKTLPDSVKRFIYRLLSQKPEIRFQSMRQLLEELGRICEQAIEIEETAITLDEELSDSHPKNPGFAPEKISGAIEKMKHRPSFWMVVSLLVVFLAAAGVALHFLAPEEFRLISKKILETLSGIGNLPVFREILK